MTAAETLPIVVRLPADLRRPVATTAAKVAIAGLVVVNVGGALTVISDQSAPPTVAPVAAGK